jgi:hypothetical protein
MHGKFKQYNLPVNLKHHIQIVDGKHTIDQHQTRLPSQAHAGMVAV